MRNPKRSRASTPEAASPWLCFCIWVLFWLPLGCAGPVALFTPTPSAQPIPARGAVRALVPVAPPRDRLGDEAVVRLLGSDTECSGTLIGPALVLTAHHCVAERSAEGRYRARDVEASELTVQLGSDYLPWGEVQAAQLVTPPCGHGGGHGDIALVVLSQPVAGIHPKSVALGQRPRPGLRFDAVGFGRCADSAEGLRLRDRLEGRVESVTESSFRAQVATCAGDSGGPALNRAGIVVGVLSASALDGQEQTKNLTEFVRLDYWQELFANAERLAAGANPAELPPISGCDEARD